MATKTGWAPAALRSQSTVGHVAAFCGAALSDDVVTLLQRALWTLSVALGVYAVGAPMAAISATFGYVETVLPFRDPAELTVRLVSVVTFYVAIFLDFGALIALLAGSADLLRARDRVPQALRRILEDHRVAVFASLGLGLVSFPILDLALTRCMDCGPAVPMSVAQDALILLGASALVLILALLRIALCFTEGRRAVVAAFAAPLPGHAGGGGFWGALPFFSRGSTR